MMGLPDPLVPKACDLRDRRHWIDTPPMPLDVTPMLMDAALCWRSETATISHVRLLARAWRNNPAASLLNEPDHFHRFLWISPKRWKSVRDEVLADWVLCSDGRLYHPWLAEQALRAWRRINARGRLDVTSAEWALLRLQTFRRDAFTCQYCDSRNGPFECDHVVPVSAGGPNILSNLVTACEDCNRRKRAMPIQRFLASDPDRLAALLSRLQAVGGVA